MQGNRAACFLLSESLLFYWKIHWRRLDYSLDTSFLGLFNTTAVSNESSRIHVAIGVVAGAVWQIKRPWRYIGLFLFVLYTARNLKHLRKMYDGFQKMGVPAPAVIRSSMTRQQMQFHAGIGFGSLIVCLTPVADSASDQ